MVPNSETGVPGGSERANAPETHLVESAHTRDPRAQFPDDAAYEAWCSNRDRQCRRDPKLVGDVVSGIAQYLPADTD